MAFKSGRDFCIFSNKRLFILDKRGVTGQKVVYLSILWESVKAFSVETVGSWNRDARDAEFNIYDVDIYTNVNEQDMRVVQQVCVCGCVCGCVCVCACVCVCVCVCV